MSLAWFLFVSEEERNTHDESVSYFMRETGVLGRGVAYFMRETGDFSSSAPSRWHENRAQLIVVCKGTGVDDTHHTCSPTQHIFA